MADNVTTTQTNIPPWLDTMAETVVNSGADLIQQPYTPYEGDRVAGFSGDTNTAFQNIRDTEGNWKPNVNNANSMFMSAGEGYGDVGEVTAERIDGLPKVDAGDKVTTGMWDGSAFQTYGNPFTAGVINPTLDEIRRQGEISRKSLGSSAVAAGAMGGARHGVAESEHMRNMQQLMNQTVSGLNLENWQQAQGMFTSDQNRKLSADQGNQSTYLDASKSTASNALDAAKANADNSLRAGMFNVDSKRNQFNLDKDRKITAGDALINSTTKQSDLEDSDNANLIAAGAMQEDKDQQNLDVAYGDFLKQEQDPYDKLNFMTGLMSGTPYSTSTTTTSDKDNGDLPGQIAGAATAIYGAGKLFDWWG